MLAFVVVFAVSVYAATSQQRAASATSQATIGGGTGNSSLPVQTTTEQPSPATDGPTESDPAAISGQSAPSLEDVSAWPIEQQVGQLFMVGAAATGDDAQAVSAIEERHVGNVFLHGRSQAGVAATRKLVDTMTALVSRETTRDLPLFVATDQEGGDVQVLRGSGFSDIPDAVSQSRETEGDLQEFATIWGKELGSAGVNLNLAPVLDVVPNKAAAANNPPIGAFKRNYGYGQKSAMRGLAFGRGMRAAGVLDTVKHFPGLGLVAANTDVSADVVDTETSASSPSVQVFRAAIEDGAPFVMVSSATYQKIDPDTIAAFSPIVIEDLLRGELGFAGVVISDDVSAAKAVAAWTPAERAVNFIAAGGDMVLVSALPSAAPEMIDAVVAKAKADPAFARRVAQSCHRVVVAKQLL
ncbi:glycoside hydrolase family 3 protein [Rarobacter incanus]|uniref:glycoside hydrolase family 3 protein n=1 Tax=Rarobacter incanus TaxID=153494 RepID=UPI001476F00B|nr:glycoside hydrolase family 3 protein [Rarobacter incanus]